MNCYYCNQAIPEGASFCPHCGRPQSPTVKRLYRSARERKILGVCGGFAEYWDTDPTLIRAVYLTLTFLSGILPGILLYFFLAIIMPGSPVPTHADR